MNNLNLDLQHKSEAELEELATIASTLLKSRRDEKRTIAIQQIQTIAAEANITVMIRGVKKEKSASNAIGKFYQNPDNKDETWNGASFKPKWLKALIKKGRNIEEFAVVAEQVSA